MTSDDAINGETHTIVACPAQRRNEHGVGKVAPGGKPSGPSSSADSKSRVAKESVSWLLNPADDSLIVFIKTFPLSRSRHLTYACDSGPREYVPHGKHPARRNIPIAEAKAHRDAWELSDFLGTWRPSRDWPTVSSKNYELQFLPYPSGNLLHMDKPGGAKRVALPSPSQSSKVNAHPSNEDVSVDETFPDVDPIRPVHVVACVCGLLLPFLFLLLCL